MFAYLSLYHCLSNIDSLKKRMFSILLTVKLLPKQEGVDKKSFKQTLFHSAILTSSNSFISAYCFLLNIRRDRQSRLPPNCLLKEGENVFSAPFTFFSYLVFFLLHKNQITNCVQPSFFSLDLMSMHLRFLEITWNKSWIRFKIIESWLVITSDGSLPSSSTIISCTFFKYCHDRPLK